jgi:hypothetical protein
MPTLPVGAREKPLFSLRGGRRETVPVMNTTDRDRLSPLPAMNGTMYIMFTRVTVRLVVRSGVVVDAPRSSRGLIGKNAGVLYKVLRPRAAAIRWLPDRAE